VGGKAVMVALALGRVGGSAWVVALRRRRLVLRTRQWPDLRRKQGAGGGPHVGALGRRRTSGGTRAAVGAWEAHGLGPGGAPITTSLVT
jgi:hypothetical protein